MVPAAGDGDHNAGERRRQQQRQREETNDNNNIATPQKHTHTPYYGHVWFEYP
jgi:hypothetical protein